MDSLTIDVSGLSPVAVGTVVEYVRRLRRDAGAVPDDDQGEWRNADPEGWTAEAVAQVRAYLRERSDEARLRCFNFAIDQGGWLSREKLFELAHYGPDRRLNGWTRPFDTICNLMVDEGTLPDDAPWVIEAVYLDNSGQASGYRIPAGVVRLAREQADRA